MCDFCGCNIPGPASDKKTMEVTILEGLLAANDQQAAHNREHLDRHGVLAINLMSSPGAGKTTLLEKTIQALAGRFRIGVIEGDLETDNDARRIRKQGVPAVQITTGGACHLDAKMVHDALHDIPLDQLDLLFIENVGNLICPAGFDLGQHRNVVLLSVVEGDDKPAKYPVIFRSAELMLITKTDFLSLSDDFDPQRAETYLRNLANAAPVIPLSARNGDGMAAWMQWLDDLVASSPIPSKP